jgi:serine/threonine protein kinase
MRKIVDNYELCGQVGSGQYGKVYKAKHKELGTYFAVKCITLEKFNRIPKLSVFTKNEIQVLNKLVHPNIVTFIERLRTANNVYMVYEFCNGGTLENHIYEKKIQNEEQALV